MVATIPFFVAVVGFTCFYAWCCWADLPIIAHEVANGCWISLVAKLTAAGLSERFMFAAVACFLLELFFWPVQLFFEVIHRNDWFAQYRLQSKRTVQHILKCVTAHTHSVYGDALCCSYVTNVYARNCASYIYDIHIRICASDADMW